MRGVYQRVATTLERYYPSRLHALYMVNVPIPLRVAHRANLQFLMGSTRAKIRVVKPKDVPCRALPSALRSHKLSTATGLEAWGYAGDAGGGGQQHLAGGGGGAPCAAAASAGSEADGWSDVSPVTPAASRTPRGGALRRGGGALARNGSGRPLGQGSQQAVGMVVTVTMAGVLAALLQKEGALVTGLRALSSASVAAGAARGPL
jgi:hypothetical protein